MESGPSPDISTATEVKYWNNRYSNGGLSGNGSYGEFLDRKIKFLSPLEVTSVVEIGCGDFNFGKHLLFQYKLPFSAYTGYDISNVIVDRNKQFYPEANFHVTEGFPDTPAGDLLLCVDVLFHIYDDEDCAQLLDNLNKLWKSKFKYLALTAYERDEAKTNHVRIRKFDPSQFGEPILREIVEEDGSLYFYIFKNDRHL